MAQEIIPIPLPWKRPYKGLMTAEFGASFRVERLDDGWQCSVQAGTKRMLVLAKGLTRQRDGQCRAEAYAATMPEVHQAQMAAMTEPEEGHRLKGSAKTSSVASADGDHRREKKSAEPAPVIPTVPTTSEFGPTATVNGAVSAVAFEQVADGCICGRLDSGTWVADPNGCIALPRGATGEDAERVKTLAAEYFERAAAAAAAAAARVDERTETPRPVNGARLKVAVATRTRPTSTRPTPTRPAAPQSKTPQSTTPRSASPPVTARPGKKAASKTKQATNAAPTGRTKEVTNAAGTAGRGKKTAKANSLAKARAAKANKAAAKAAVPVPTTTPAKGAKASRSKGKRSAKRTPARTVDESTTRAQPDAAPTVKSASKKTTPVTTPPADAQTKEGSTPQLQWFDVEGRPRANTPYGSFAIEPEGDRQVLYFYDLNGMSIFIADRGELRQIAAERAARGGVRPGTLQRTPDLDARMRDVFFGEDAR